MLNLIRRLSQLVSITRHTISKIGTVLHDMDSMPSSVLKIFASTFCRLSKLVLETQMSSQSCARTTLSMESLLAQTIICFKRS